MALDVGSRIAHYDVTALIGEGGMGQVWQATDTQLNRQVREDWAVKLTERETNTCAVSSRRSPWLPCWGASCPSWHKTHLPTFW